MNLKFMKRSLTQSIAIPQFAGIRVASANSVENGLDGCAATYQEVCDSNPVSVRESNRMIVMLSLTLTWPGFPSNVYSVRNAEPPMPSSPPSLSPTHKSPSMTSSRSWTGSLTPSHFEITRKASNGFIFLSNLKITIARYL